MSEALESAAPDPSSNSPATGDLSSTGMSSAEVSTTPAASSISAEIASGSAASTGGAAATATDPAAQAATQSAAQSALDPAFASHMRETYGIDPAQFQSPTQAIDYFAQAAYAGGEAVQLVPQLQAQLAELQRQLYGGQNTPAPGQALAAQQGTPQAAAAANAAQTAAKYWNPPEFEPQWMDYLRYDREAGAYVPKHPGVVDPAIVQKANARAAYQQQFNREFMQNPEETMWKVLEHRFEEKMQSYRDAAAQQAIQHYEQQQAQQQQTQSVNSVLTANSDWLYARDAHGNQVVGAHGAPLFSAEGMSYVKAVQELVGSGVNPNDTTTLNRLALQMIGKQAKAQTPNAQDRAAQFAAVPPNGLAQAMHSPSQNGSLTPSAAGATISPPAGTSAWDIARRIMLEQGISTDGIATSSPLA